MELSTVVSRIEASPEVLQEIIVGQEPRVVRDTNSFVVTGRVRAHVSVCWVLRVTTGVTGFGVEHTGQLLKRRFHTPEATTRKCGCAHELFRDIGHAASRWRTT